MKITADRIKIFINGVQVLPNPLPEPFYTEKQLNEEREKAFNAARERIGGAWNEQIKNWACPTFKDYINPSFWKHEALKKEQASFNKK